MPTKNKKTSKINTSKSTVLILVGLLLILTSPTIRPAIEAVFRAVCSQVICGLDILTNMAWVIPLPYVWVTVGFILLIYGVRGSYLKK